MMSQASKQLHERAGVNGWLRVLRVIWPWAVLLAVAFILDKPVAQWMYDWRPAIPRHFIHYQNGPISRNDWIARIARAPGDFRFTLVVSVLLAIWHRDRGKAAGALLLCGIASGSNEFFKWIFGRPRPFRDGAPWSFFESGLTGIIEQVNVSFPSGHASLAFATAEALSVLLPKYRGWFYAGGVIVGIERISENAHYCSDIVAGAMVGVFCARAVMWIINKSIHRPA